MLKYCKVYLLSATKFTANEKLENGQNDDWKFKPDS